MSDDDAFLAAIRDRPDDATLRLVYADWLEERHDPRDELIRVEAAMRAVPIWSDEFQRLKPARSRLRAALPRDWLAAMDYLPKHRPMFGTLPPTFEERWRLAEEFIDVWHGGVKPGDGYTEAEVTDAETRLGCRLPTALREWYRRAGRRHDVWANQDPLLTPAQLGWDAVRLEFKVENQNNWEWFIRPQDAVLDDPPVFWTEGDAPIFEAVSLAMLFVLVYEFLTREGAEGNYPCVGLTGRSVPERCQQLQRLWSGEEADAFQFWEDVDTILWEGNFAVCRTNEAHQQLVAEFGDRIERLE